MRFAFSFLVLLLLTACGSPGSRVLRNSPDYKAGYSDGCASASLTGANPRDSGLTRDDAAYGSNPAYHSGWGTGFGACRAMAMPSSPGGMPGTP